MPQIRCPNCGMTISLKNRKEADEQMITNAVRGGPKTFTYLLHTTRLPRKTLSLRLKELCEGGMMAKDEEGYVLNGTPVFSSRIGGALNRFSSMSTDKRVRAGILLALLIVSMPVAAQVLAQFFNAQPSTQPEVPAVASIPTVAGNFTMTLDVQNVNDLYFWQVAITFNAKEMKVLSVAPGVFPESQYPGMLTSADNKNGLLTVGDFLLRPVLGWSGSGRLSTIVFGYFTNGYTLPKISMTAAQETTLLDSSGNAIPLGQQTTLSLNLP
jgi:DNA-directed RNA polymerase subunit RPC12/RpoP